MLDGLNSGFQAFLNPGDKLSSGKGERLADAVLWVPRKLWADREIDVVATATELPGGTHQSGVPHAEGHEVNSLAKIVRRIDSPMKVLAYGCFGVLSLLASPLLLLGAIVKGLSVAPDALSRKRFVVVQKDLHQEILTERHTEVGTRAYAVLNDMIDSVFDKKPEYLTYQRYEYSQAIMFQLQGKSNLLNEQPYTEENFRTQTLTLVETLKQKKEWPQLGSILKQLKTIDQISSSVDKAYKAALVDLNATMHPPQV